MAKALVGHSRQRIDQLEKKARTLFSTYLEQHHLTLDLLLPDQAPDLPQQSTVLS